MEEKKEYKRKKEEDVVLVRVLGKDIRGDIKIRSALTKINGISWAISNAVCKILELDKEKKIQDFEKDELARIEDFMKAPELPVFLRNRQKDFDSGEDVHISGIDLKLRTEFDLKRLKKIKSYKGIRHIVGLPVRGQRTKSNFRKNRKPSVAAAKKKG
ncbi:30S ribosomal protein S13 [archaeon]|jgi:small subunit ribosomal protein S13|nr:30S ribosomal protein S13 [archaeon]MBT7128964.1 30S ribosomal protein S13 [archaeon]